MINALYKFQEKVKQLLSFLNDAEIINALVSADIIKEESNNDISDFRSLLIHLQSSNIDRKIQNYVSSVILLYGLFEQYVEEVLMAYLEELESTINNFDDIPEKIKSNHTKLSAQLLINSGLDKYRDRCNEAEIIQRMYSCVSGRTFRLNAIAFIDHKANFRIDTLNQFFELAGISGISAHMKKTKAFEEYKAIKFPNEGIENMPDKVVYGDLDDLAWQRNVVAHGWPDETLSIEMMKERTEFIRVLGECIFEVLWQNMLRHIVKNRGRALPKPLAVHNNSIVCLHLEEGSISNGNRIIAHSPNQQYYESKIKTIEVNHVEKTEVIAPPSVDVAFLVNFKAKKNYKYFLIDE